MLYRPTTEIEYRIRDYFMYKLKGEIIGCIAFRVWNKKSSEIYALAVDPRCLGKGVGRKLIKSCVIDAKKIGVQLIFALTFRGSLFTKFGFKKIGINSLPRIIFTEKTIDADKAFGLRVKQ